jgi:hypothetical protein
VDLGVVAGFLPLPPEFELCLVDGLTPLLLANADRLQMAQIRAIEHSTSILGDIPN